MSRLSSLHLIPLERERRSSHHQIESEIGQWEDPPTAVINAIPDLVLSLLIKRTNHQIDHDRCAHGEEAEVQKTVHQCEVGDVGQELIHHDLVSDACQDPDERNADAIAQR